MPWRAGRQQRWGEMCFTSLSWWFVGFEVSWSKICHAGIITTEKFHIPKTLIYFGVLATHPHSELWIYLPHSFAQVIPLNISPGLALSLQQGCSRWVVVVLFHSLGANPAFLISSGSHNLCLWSAPEPDNFHAVFLVVKWPVKSPKSGNN